MLSFQLDSSPPIEASPSEEFLQRLLRSLLTCLRAYGEEVEGLRVGCYSHASLSLSLPSSLPYPSLLEDADSETACSLPSAAQRHLTLCVTRRSSAPLALWESPLVTEQRGEAYLTARRHAEEDSELASVWRLPPIDTLLLLAQSVEEALPEAAAVAQPVRAFRRRAFELGEQRERVRAGGALWTRQEQLKLLATLRAQVHEQEPASLSEAHKAVMAAFSQGERALGGEEEEEQEGGGPMAGALPSSTGGLLLGGGSGGDT